MTTRPDDDGEEDINGESDNTPITAATQTLDLLALHLPPEKLIPHLVSLKKNHRFNCERRYINTQSYNITYLFIHCKFVLCFITRYFY